MTTLLSLLPDVDDAVDAAAAVAVDDGNVLVVDCDAVDGWSGQADDADADTVGFSSFDDFSTSDFITAVDSLMLLISPTTGMLAAGSVDRLSDSPWDEDDNADLPQAVGEIIERRIIETLILDFWKTSLNNGKGLRVIF